MKYITLPKGASERELPFFLATEEWAARQALLSPEEDGGNDLFMMWQVGPTVIFGRHQVVEAEVNLDYCRSNGIGMYRRKSGGGCVYADMGNVMFSFITKEENVNLTYNRLMNMMVLVLRRLGVEATSTSHNDVLVAGRKVSGTAYYHLPGASIVHGTMLYDTMMEHMVNAITPPQQKLEKHGVQSVRQRIGLLKDCVGLSLSELMTFVRQTLCEGELLLTEADVEAIETIEQEYLREDFIFRK